MDQKQIAKDFLTTLYGGTDAGSWLAIWGLPSRRTRWHRVEDLDGAAQTAVEMSKAGAGGDQGVYFGLGLQRRSLGPSHRGTAADVVGLPGLWADIDIQGPGHKSGKRYPESLEAALEFAHALPIAPSMIIHSGGGLHVYWLLERPWIFRDEEDRERAAQIVSAWGRLVVQAAGARGLEIDQGVFELGRVLRVPGTFNRKQATGSVEVRILERTDRRYRLEEVKEILATIPAMGRHATIPEGVPGARSQEPKVERIPAGPVSWDELPGVAVRRGSWLRKVGPREASWLFVGQES